MTALVRVGIVHVRSSIYVAQPTSGSQFSAAPPLSHTVTITINFGGADYFERRTCAKRWQCLHLPRHYPDVRDFPPILQTDDYSRFCDRSPFLLCTSDDHSRCHALDHLLSDLFLRGHTTHLFLYEGISISDSLGAKYRRRLQHFNHRFDFGDDTFGQRQISSQRKHQSVDYIPDQVN